MKNKIPYLTQLVSNLAPKVGASVVVEPEWGVASQIIYKNGVVRSVFRYAFDLNSIASADIAKDKGYAKYFMEKKGYPVAEGTTILEEKWARTIKGKRNLDFAKKYIKKIGFPAMVKPNSKSQGVGVHLVHSLPELEMRLKEIFKDDRVAVLEKYLPGRDYRIVVLDSEIISAYERIPLSVTGDGVHSVRDLLVARQKSFISSGRDTKINFNESRIKTKLKKQKLSLLSVVSKNEKVFLLDNANLSTGGDAIDVSDTIHPGFRKVAQSLTKDMGLRMAGVDIMITSGEISENPKKCSYYIIEINAAPGLDHYITTGKAQKRKVEEMYLKVIRALGKK